MKVPNKFACLLLNFIGMHAFIIPDEVPSLLSVIYSNIPTLKKGTDSRVGWGFRLGDRADFQVLMELGPQTNTQPLANQGGEGGSANKRNTLDTLANKLYAQRQEEKRKNKKQTEGEQWLRKWSKTVTTKQEVEEEEEVPLKPRPGIAVGEIDAKSVIPEDDSEELSRKGEIVK